MLIEELEFLSRKESAKFTLTIDCGVPMASWKIPGNRAEKVTSFRDRETVNMVLASMLERLDRHVPPSNELMFERMNPNQRAKLKKIFADFKALKREVMNPTPIEVIERGKRGPASCSESRTANPIVRVARGHARMESRRACLHRRQPCLVQGKS